MTSGPLAGIRVVELAGLGPAPFACMLLADFGATVVRIDRPGTTNIAPAGHYVLGRGRSSVAFDLKKQSAVDAVLDLVAAADVLVEGFRPGVAERLGLGPEPCSARNPRLVYGRMTGWGQEGPMADRVGHDINYAGLTGALAAIGEPGRKPVPPLNLVADFGGGALYLVAGILAALVERTTSGLGQVVDAAMVDGVTSLMAMAYGFRSAGQWHDERGANLLDGGAPFYDTYRCADGGYMAVGALEPQFWAATVTTLGLVDPPGQWETDRWPQLRELLADTFARRTRDEWAETFAGVDACVTPVLELGEAAGHPHLAARRTVVDVAGLAQPAVAPRLSRTPGAVPAAEPAPGADTTRVLSEWGSAPDRISGLLEDGAAVQA